MIFSSGYIFIFVLLLVLTCITTITLYIESFKKDKSMVLIVVILTAITASMFGFNISKVDTFIKYDNNISISDQPNYKRWAIEED